MCTFKDFLCWYNNKHVVPTLEANQKMPAFCHKKEFDMLMIGCKLPNLRNIWLRKSTSARFNPTTETDKDLLQKIREGLVCGPSLVCIRKAVVDETYIRNSGIICKSLVGIYASQLYPYSMRQPIPTGLYTRWECDTETKRFKPQQNKSRNFENMVMSYFRRQRPTVKKRASSPQDFRKRLIISRQRVLAHIVILWMRLYTASIIIAHVRKHKFLQLKKISNTVTKREKWTRWETRTSKKKDTKFMNCGKVNGGISLRRQRVVKNIWENHFFTNVHWEKRDCWNKQEAAFFLVMYNVTLKCLEISTRNLLTFQPFSKIQT